MWADGDAYELYVGRWSRLVARDFLRWVGAGPGLRWLDVGCGTGALSSAILAQCDPVEVVGVDQSEAHVAWTARRHRRRPGPVRWSPTPPRLPDGHASTSSSAASS